MTLYPLKFKPNYKEKIWGGNSLKKVLNKTGASEKTGESWEISGIEGELSVIANGFLQDNDLQDLIEIYMGELVGERIYAQYGLEFPLLIKFIDAQDVLSIQVHPDDALAKERHNAYGKTEMWYIIDAAEKADIITGFNQKLDKAKYLEHFNKGELPQILKRESITQGDAFFMPAGRVHAIGKGTLLAEIQQTSDITYRIYDWDRKDDKGNERELHTDLAVDAIDFNMVNNAKIDYKQEVNHTTTLKRCNYFTTNILEFDQIIARDYNLLDSFVIYMCMEGKFTIDYNGEEKIELSKGETVLIPNELSDIKLTPNGKAKILEVYLEEIKEK